MDVREVIRELIDAGREHEAIKLIEEELVCEPNNIQLLVNLGMCWLRLSNYPSAEMAFRRCIEIKKDYAAAHSQLGAVFMETGRLEESAREFEISIDLNPTASRYVLLGAVWLELNRLGFAEEAFRNALRIDAEDEDANVNLGMLLRLEGSVDAEFYLDRAVSINPMNPISLREFGSYKFSIGDHESAIGLLRRAVELDPADRWSHIYLAGVLEEVGKFCESDKELRLAVAIDPSEPFPMFRIAMLSLKLGDPRGAVEGLRRTLKVRDDFVPACYELGALLLADGSEEAGLWLKKCARLDPDGDYGKRAKRLLNGIATGEDE